MKTNIENNSIKAVISHKGAELSSLEKNGENYIWDIDNAFWDKTSPILFPVIGALKNEEFEFEGKKYQLPRHGFAREKEFKVVSKSDNSVVFSLKSDEETLDIYPFEFELQISYSIENSELFIGYKIINAGKENMYYSIGAHPAFRIEGSFGDYSLKFDSDQTLISHQLENNLFHGKTVEIPLQNSVLPLSYDLFDNDAIVLKNNSTKTLELQYKSISKLKVKFNDFPYLGIWTKRNAPFICIEPWLGIADNEGTSGRIEEKEGIQILESGAQNSFEWSVELL